MKNQNTAELSSSELYAIQFQNCEPSHYTRIPNILKDLTYDFVDPVTGESSIKRLSVNARILYMELKSIAGDIGKCWLSRNKLAEACNLSTGAITNAKKELVQKFHQLDGNPLIVITERRKPTKKDGFQNKTEYHEITIVDIWNYNRAFNSVKNVIRKTEVIAKSYPSPKVIKNTESDSENNLIQGERGHVVTVPPGRGHVVTAPPQGARSCGDTNNSKHNINYLYREQQKAPNGAPAVFLSIDKSVPSADQSMQFKENPSEEESRFVSWICSLGATQKQAERFLRQFSMKDLMAAYRYSREQAKKGEKIDNVAGYFTSTLQNRWWESKEWTEVSENSSKDAQNKQKQVGELCTHQPTQENSTQAK